MQPYLDPGTTEQRSTDAKKTITAGTRMIYDCIKSTLGPRGMTKLLTSENKIQITNDGATILKNLVIDSASAKILIESSIGQDWEEGDGTTTIAILASLLIEEANKLEISPILIIKGYEMALEKSLEIIENNSFLMKDEDEINLAKTTLNSKILRCDLQKFAKICVDAINILENENLDLINFIKTEGELENSFLSDGFILDRNTIIPKIENPKILLANTSMDQDKIKIHGAQVNVKSVFELSRIEDAEHERMQEKVDLITKEEKIDVFINRQIMYDHFLELFREKNIIAIEHADFEGVERLSKVLNAKIMSTFDTLNETLGTCKKMENIFIGEKRMIKFSGLKKGACTIVLKGSSKEILDEAERSIHDALCVLMKIKKEKKICLGGGSIETEISIFLNNMALKNENKESSAILAFSNAILKIPEILAKNCGLDSEKIKNKLRAYHIKNKKTFGVSILKKDVNCMKEENVFESLRIKKRILTAAVEAACLIVKCDGIVKCKPVERMHP